MAIKELSEEAIFNLARKIDSAEARTDYLDQACGQDAALRARLHALLEVYEQESSFLCSPAAVIATSEDPIQERPGTTIGRYKLLEQIGEGGFGLVFMAEQQQPVRRKVAVKVLKPGMDSRQVIARFEAERQALALMDHPNIARVLEAGETETGRPYFAMELVRGVPITDYCDKNNLTPRERLELFLTVCQAVQHAHQKGIIHRDLKPSNIMVTLHDGVPVVKVIDFGIAKALGQQLTEKTLYTAFAQLVGTPLYMSPEQAEMSGLDVDTRSDIYSLGVLLYELLTGATPFDKERLSKVGQDEMRRIIREEEPVRPSTRLSKMRSTERAVPGVKGAPVPCFRGESPLNLAPRSHAAKACHPSALGVVRFHELDWVVMKALEKDRNRRYETAASFAADVQRFLHDEPVLACPPSSWYRFRKFARRRRGPLALAGVAALSLLVIAVGSLISALYLNEALQESESNRRRAEGAEEEAREAEKAATAAEKAAMERLYTSLVAQARASRLSRHMGQRFKSLDTLVEAAKLARNLNSLPAHALELRNEAIACLALADLRVAREWDGWPADSMTVEFDSAFRRYARVDRGGIVHIQRVSDGSEVRPLEGFGPGDFGGGEAHPHFSPDGCFLLLTHGTNPFRVKLWALAGQLGVSAAGQSQEPALIPLEHALCTAHAFSADSQEMALAHADGSIHVYDLPSGRQRKQLKNVPNSRYLAFHPKARQLALSHIAGVHVRDLETGDVLADLPDPAGCTHIAWHPDGKTLAAGGGDGIIHLWDVATRKPIVRLEGRENRGLTFAFNRAGNLLAGTGWDGLLHLWDTRTGRHLFSTQTGVGSLRFSPDDKLLAAGLDNDDHKLRLWEVALPLTYRTLVRESVREGEGYGMCAVSPKGGLLAVGQNSGIALWDLDSGNQLTLLELGPSAGLFEPSGALLTAGLAGLRRWPIQGWPIQSDDVAPVLRIGPPEKVPLRCWGAMAMSQDGRVLASGGSRFHGSRGLVWRRDQPGPPLQLPFHKDPRHIAVSADGDWVATGSHFGTKVKIASARTAKLAHELPVDGSSRVHFGPGWLATSGGGCRLWAIGSWEPGPRIGGLSLAFSPDGKILAVETGYGVIRLVAPSTGREYVRLEDPNQARAYLGCFSSDGSQLITTNGDSGAVQIWDLHVIREQLTALGLDWEGGGARGEGRARTISPLTVKTEVDFVNWAAQGAAWVDQRNWQKAVAALDKALDLEPGIPIRWLESACVRLRSGDSDGYRQLCARMMEWSGQSTSPLEVGILAHTCILSGAAPVDFKMMCWFAEWRLAATRDSDYLGQWSTHVLALARYRAGEYDRTVACLEKAVKEHADWSHHALNASVLAMAHHRLGHPAEARRWLDKAQQQIDKENRTRPQTGGAFAPPAWAWRDWLAVELLNAEAQALIKEPVGKQTR